MTPPPTDERERESPNRTEPTMPNSSMHVWTNDCDYVAAADIDDARRVLTEFMGPMGSGVSEDDLALDLEMLPDDRAMTWAINEHGEIDEAGGPGVSSVKITCRELCDRFGRRYLGSTEC